MLLTGPKTTAPQTQAQRTQTSGSMMLDERSMVPKGPSLRELRLLCQQSGAEEPRKNAEVTPHPSARALGAPGFVSACVFWHDGSMIVQAIVQVRLFKITVLVVDAMRIRKLAILHLHEERRSFEKTVIVVL